MVEFIGTRDRADTSGATLQRREPYKISRRDAVKRKDKIAFELVVCHGDWPFNLLQSADGAIFLIDWDDLPLAPADWLADLRSRMRRPTSKEG